MFTTEKSKLHVREAMVIHYGFPGYILGPSTDSQDQGMGLKLSSTFQLFVQSTFRNFFSISLKMEFQIRELEVTETIFDISDADIGSGVEINRRCNNENFS